MSTVFDHDASVNHIETVIIKDDGVVGIRVRAHFDSTYPSTHPSPYFFVVVFTYPSRLLAIRDGNPDRLGGWHPCRTTVQYAHWVVPPPGTGTKQHSEKSSSPQLNEHFCAEILITCLHTERACRLTRLLRIMSPVRSVAVTADSLYVDRWLSSQKLTNRLPFFFSLGTKT